MRAAAVRLAEREPENAQAIREAIWDRSAPIDWRSAAEAKRQLELAEALLREHPDDGEARLVRGVSLYHLGRFADAGTVLAALRFDPHERGEYPDEGIRLAFLALARAAEGRRDEAHQVALELERKHARFRDWHVHAVVRDALAAVRLAIPPPPIPQSD